MLDQIRTYGAARAIDRFVERMRDESDAALAPMIKPMLRRLKRTGSYDELKRELARTVAEMDTSKFVELLGRAGFFANLAVNTSGARLPREASGRVRKPRMTERRRRHREK